MKIVKVDKGFTIDLTDEEMEHLYWSIKTVSLNRINDKRKAHDMPPSDRYYHFGWHVDIKEALYGNDD